MASNFLVTLHRAAVAARRRRRRAAGGARAADAADDRERLRADRADRARRPCHGRPAPRGDPRATSRELEPLYAALAEATRAVNVVRTVAEVRAALAGRTASSASCRRWARSTPATTRCSGGAAGLRRARREPLRQPRAVRRPGRPRRVPARPRRRRARRGGARRRRAVRAGARRDVPARLRHLGRCRRAPRRARGRPTAPAISAASRPSA